ncbi:MAPEG family protein [Niveibacterium sp. 24ML]|uniref:MAPEG family protein n=1 Tax=Niveibacterium sp. 24ML TaxID=2985512 RepID=UPI00226E2426|nr:MAPEG family protein [Niveibacterium sp. 24ML]MCX9158067.1 MAPEG family protein [Niveibacterium sp. 24ML]
MGSLPDLRGCGTDGPPRRVPAALINPCVVRFVVARFAYPGCYFADLATLRSPVWLIGISACVRLMWAAV